MAAGKNASRVGDVHVCIVHGGGPIVSAGPAPTVVADGLPAARLGDFAFCPGSAPNLLVQGSATVLVNGLPWVGVTDLTTHGGTVTTGAGTVFVGTESFVPPSVVSIGGDRSFKNKVIRDLFMLSTTRSGKALFDRLEAAGQSVNIQPYPYTDNSTCRAMSGADARAGRPTGSFVKYHPEVALLVSDKLVGYIDEPPQVVLAHELVHALHNSEGKATFGTDPNPPASEPTMREEEAGAVGVGSHENDPLSENTVRDDLGLPRRRDHHGQPVGAPQGDMRPGGY